jgi:hypothetical protein
MSRYSSIPEIRDSNNVRRRGTTILPVVPLSPDDTYIETTSLDRLDKLAYIFYDDSTLWWIIASANGLGKGSLIVPEGTKLRIPSKINIQDVIIRTNRDR